ncbi:Ribonuclease H domain [Arabidopsis suecica]|uniref:DNA ligase n=1 Tax=Arabidopsis suecica TaxID=45249 RepID=A0A8T2CNN0_ARASU|nr:Ribonuclease H domain [Arabidopsis suecica]
MFSSSSQHRSAFDVLMSNASAKKKRKLEEIEDTPSRVRISDSAKPKSDRVTELKSKIGLLKKKPADFDPSKVSCWDKGERVPFLFLSLAFDLIAVESSRIVITDILCNMLRTVIATTPEDLLPTVYLAANEIAPAHEGVKLGIGKGSSIIKAISEAFGRTKAQVKQQYTQLGDLGLVAQGSRSSQTMIFMPKPLTVVKVADTLRQIAKESGKGSKDKKKILMKALLVATTDCEPLYLTRLLQDNLRLGFSRQTVLAALGQAAVYNEEHSKPPPNIKNPLDEAATIVKEVFSVLPVYDIIVGALLTSGVWNLPKTCNLTPGVPVRAMLAKATTSVDLILEKFGDTVFTAEYKYDGERAQIHYMEDGTIEIFSRHAERNTGKYPDVALALSRFKKPSVKSFILDCEVVAFNREEKKLLPLQTLSTRAHKNVNVSDIKVGVCVFAFDILYLNGQLLIQENLNIRREILSFKKRACGAPWRDAHRGSMKRATRHGGEARSMMRAPYMSHGRCTRRSRRAPLVESVNGAPQIRKARALARHGAWLIQGPSVPWCALRHLKLREDPGYFQFATALTSNDIGELQEFLKASIDIGCEGLMIKSLYSNATYEPAKRSNNWLKLKKDYMDSIGDSVDLVPIAAFHGRGKRTGFFGAFLLACYDVDKEEFQSICKIGTGFSDAELQELSSSLCSKVIAIPKQYYQVDDGLNPDVWLEPTEVWEVKAADLTISHVYRAAIGIVDPDKGISLRFPRLVRVRKDKNPEEATSSDQIAEMYQAQKHNQPSNQGKERSILSVWRWYRVGATIPSNGRTRRVESKFLMFLTTNAFIATFFFGNMWKSVFDSLVLVFVEHPFDVGDRCEIGEIEMIVEDIEVLSTHFVGVDKKKYRYTNLDLWTKAVCNHERSQCTTWGEIHIEKMKERRTRKIKVLMEKSVRGITVSRKRSAIVAVSPIELHHETNGTVELVTRSRVGDASLDSNYSGCRCFMDGSWKESDKFSGIGWFCTSSNGEPPTMGAANLRRSLSPLHIEFEALLWAMKCMIGADNQNVAFLTDCSDLVKMVSSPTEWPAFSVYLEEFQSDKEEFSSFSLSLISRNANVKADNLARKIRTKPFHFTYVNNIPQEWLY